jgi:DNA helicase II / ATP-dependent DNA helicase PcrA
MRWFDDLSDEQMKAASHNNGHARILAGPGTGKTRTLTHHVAYLISELKVSPENIAVITFTKAAGNDLKKKLSNQLGLSQDDALYFVGTFHSFAFKTLLANPQEAGISSSCSVADDYEDKILLSEIGSIIGMTPKQAGDIYKAYQAKWNTLGQDNTWEKYQQSFEQAKDELVDLYKFMFRGELIYKLFELIDDNPIAIKKMGIRHILVDEYQDLNYCELQVLQKFTNRNASLYVVGDDNQSIYEFRHASPSGIRNFTTKDYPGSSPYELTISHRCPKKVLELAENLIGKGKKRITRSLKPEDDTNIGEVHALQFETDTDEVNTIANICKIYIESGKLLPNEIVVLASRNKFASHIAEVFENLGLSVVSLGSESPLDEHGSREFYCVLRLFVNENDTLALRTWLELQIGIGPKAINLIRQQLQNNRINLRYYLFEISDNPDLLPRFGKTLKQHFDDLVKKINRLKNLSDNEALRSLLDEKSQGTASKIINLIENISPLEQVDDLKKLVRGLQTLDLKKEALSESESHIRIMTIHKSKGLEFPLVIIPGLERYLLPGDWDKEHIRRLMYVAITRSQQYLILTHSRDRTTSNHSHWGSGHDRAAYGRQRSPYLRKMGIASDLGDEFLEQLREQLPPQTDEQSFKFDVFLCHNSDDKPEIRKIAAEIKKRKKIYWLDEEQCQPGLPFQRCLEEAIPIVKSAAVFVGENGVGPWQRMEIYAFLQELVDRGCPVIPIILPGCEETPKLPPFIKINTWIDFRQIYPDPMKQLIWGISGKKPYW